MRIRKIVRLSTLGAFLAALTLGCQSSEVEGLKVPEKTPPPPEQAAPLPKEMTKGGGPGSSGNMMRRDPGADPLKK
jgi:hypothetical protein